MGAVDSKASFRHHRGARLFGAEVLMMAAWGSPEKGRGRWAEPLEERRGEEVPGGRAVCTPSLVCPGNGGFALLVLAFSEELRPAEVAWGAFCGRLSAHPILLSRDVAKVTCASCPL